MQQGLTRYVLGLALAVLALPVQAQTDEAAWQAALIGQDIGQLQSFVKDHPQSPHLPEAEALLAKTLTTARGMGLMPVQAVDSYPAQKELIEAAQGAKTAAAYQAYLTAYPQGLFAGLAQTELALLALAPAEVAPDPAPPADVAPNPAADLAGLTFTTPFPVGEHVKGRSIAELIASATPQFSPIEGLPDAAWRDKTCANCHAWNEASLCDQAQTYTKPTAAEALAKPHPLGETFKLGLQQWALGGCK